MGQFSQTALLKMGASSSGDAFKFQLDKAGRLQLLGEGGFGEVNHCYMITFKNPIVCGNDHLPGAAAKQSMRIS